MPIIRRDLPSARLGASATFVPSGSGPFSDPAIYVLGGFSGGHASLSEFNVFNLRHQRWYKHPPAGSPPCARESHSAIYWSGAHSSNAEHSTDDIKKHSRKIVFYGGTNCSSNQLPERLRDIVFYDISEHRWSRPDTKGSIPPGRAAHSSVILGTKMIVFGGYEESKRSEAQGHDHMSTDSQRDAPVVGDTPDFGHCSNSLHVFDLETETWQPVDLDSAQTQTPNAPTPRARHAAALAGNVMLVFGGNIGHDSASSLHQCTDDLWALEIGPPPSPGSLSINRTVPQPGQNVSGPCLLKVFWEDSFSWIPGRSYELQVQDVHEDHSTWTTIYSGSERECNTYYWLDTGNQRASKLARQPFFEFLKDHVYFVRVIAVNFAGNSLGWVDPDTGRTVEPMLIRNGKRLQEATIDFALPPVKPELKLLPESAIVSSIDDKNVGIGFGWQAPRLKLVSSLEHCVEARAIVKLSLRPSELPIQKRSHKKRKPQRNSHSTRDGELLHDSNALIGDWIRVAITPERYRVFSLDAMQSNVLCPTLFSAGFQPDPESDLVALEESGVSTTQSTDEAGGLSSQSVASIETKRKRTRGDEVPPKTVGFALGHVSHLEYEFRVAQIKSSDAEPLASDWSREVSIQIPCPPIPFSPEKSASPTVPSPAMPIESSL
eukprot:jgi/Hompol1/6431/HPOL_002896-RA